MVVTVDGDAAAYHRAEKTLRVAEIGTRPGATVIRVEQTHDGSRVREGRLGVAANKNTGLEHLMGAGVDHLFLSDDDCGPLAPSAIKMHVELAEQGGVPHSMVCWGKSRNPVVHASGCADWRWPRGVLLYQTREVVEKVGGMVEAFGPGGHEHAEYSRRIHQHGLTPVCYPTPINYAWRGMGATAFWACEDMPHQGEPISVLGRRRKAHTSLRRKGSDWPDIDKVMQARDGDTSFVPYTAIENGRGPATLPS